VPVKISAMIFAAGLGTRLYPLTADKPKALVEINGQTLLEITIGKLIQYNVKDIVVNVHHFSSQIIDFLNTHHFDANILISDESRQLLDTAGGLKFAESLFSGCNHILLHNVDIVSSINLTSFINHHLSTNALVTLAVKERSTSRYFIFDRLSMQLCGWKNSKENTLLTVKETPNPIELAFSGIHIVKKELLNFIPSTEKKSLTPLYLELAENQSILGYLHQKDSWMDVGRYEDYLKIGKQL